MTLRLDRLQASNFNARGMQTLWQRHCEAIEAANTDLQSQITAIAAAQAAANAAQSTANTAVTNAATAQTTANTANTTATNVKRTDKISGSSIIPANVLTASDAGASATIVVAAHTRLYGDGAQLSVGGHTFTGKSYSTQYAVYYNDTTTADTTPTYQITTTLSNALPNFASGRHFVGNVTTPAAGAPATTGGTTPPGADPADRGNYGTL